jgi:hypothetical protein
MFIGRRVKNPVPTPFGGAEFKYSFTTPAPFRSSERNRWGDASRSINMSPLRGENNYQ